MDEYNAWSDQLMQGAALLNDSLQNAATNEYNYQIAKENREYQYETNVEFWNMQNEYNNPKQAMQRLVDAGINPYVAASKVANVNQAAELHSPTAEIPPAIPPVYSSMVFSQMAQAMASLADARHQDAQTKETIDLLGGKIKQLNVQNEQSEFDLEMDKLFKGAERDSGIQHMRSEMTRNLEQAKKFVEEGHMYQYQAKKEEMMAQFYEYQGKIEQARFERIQEFLDRELRVMDSQIFKNTSEGQAAQASAFASAKQAEAFVADAAFKRAQTKTEDGIRDARIAIEGLSALMTGAKTYQEFIQAKFCMQKTLLELKDKEYITQQDFLKAGREMQELQWFSQSKAINQNNPLLWVIGGLK